MRVEVNNKQVVLRSDGDDDAAVLKQYVVSGLAVDSIDAKQSSRVNGFGGKAEAVEIVLTVRSKNRSE